MIISYLKYLYNSSYYKGHGVHSPYVYTFVRKVLFAPNSKNEFADVEQMRRKLLKDNNFVKVKDLGAGSRTDNNVNRKISALAKNSSVRHKYGKLLARMIQFYKPNTVLELGTALGVSTAYLSKHLTNNDKLYTIEGDTTLLNIAENNLKSITTTNIHFINDNFDNAIPHLINNEVDTLDFVFIDGNHKKDATIRYFNQLLEKTNNNTILVFDDIHWSKDMEMAWEYIVSHTKTKVSIDLFQFGIVFFRKELSKQHYIIKYF